MVFDWRRQRTARTRPGKGAAPDAGAARAAAWSAPERPLGSWRAARGAGADSSGVLPEEILRKVRRLEIRTRAAVTEVFAGQYHSVFKGRGMEFAEVREYTPGDDIRTIDWNVTARYGTPFVKKYVEERELTIFLAVDLSGSQSFGSRGRSKLEAAAEVGALIAFSAINNHDKVGLLTFTDRPETFIPPHKGRAHGLRLIREILYGRPAGNGTDMAGACERIARVLRRRSVVFLLSDFLVEAGPLDGPLGTLARKHDLIGVEIRDPFEQVAAAQAASPGPQTGLRTGWPDLGLIEWEDPETGKRFLFDTSDPAALGRLARAEKAREAAIASLFARHRVDRVTLRAGEDAVDPLLAFFRLRAKRLARE